MLLTVIAVLLLGITNFRSTYIILTILYITGGPVIPLRPT
jgi:hypothetical protein